MEAYKDRRIQITEPGLDTYTGPIGMVEFVDGRSSTEVNWQIAQQIGASFRIEDADVPGHQISASADMLRGRDMPADAEQVAAFDCGEQLTDGKAVALEHYTREQMEEIADQEGLAGVREIARKWGRTGRSIKECIDATIEAQVAEMESRN